ncbi:acyl carrier protein, partial [Acinetobacter baumannii]
TRKVKRREVVQLLQTLEEGTRALASARNGRESEADWLIEIVAQVANRSRAHVTLDTRLSDLGFDSLMYVELASAIEQAGAHLRSP